MFNISLLKRRFNSAKRRFVRLRQYETKRASVTAHAHHMRLLRQANEGFKRRYTTITPLIKGDRSYPGQASYAITALYAH
jgi:hypothetical protein